MSEERESLADQAAAWVPPWDRARQQEPVDATAAMPEPGGPAGAMPPAASEPGGSAGAMPPAAP
ncbi:MAG TPA: hypothetical protein VI011_21115 [Asanoa sp.]